MMPEGQCPHPRHSYDCSAIAGRPQTTWARRRLARKSLSESDCRTTRECAAMPHRDRSRHGHSLHGCELVALGHEVKQVPAAYAKPFRQGHKNDFRDAHAVAEAVQRPSTRCVPIKTDDQLDLQALHRVRSRLIGDRTAINNQLRGFLLEHGLPVRQGHCFLRQQLPQILATRTDLLSPRMVRIIGDLIHDGQEQHAPFKGPNTDERDP